jgi:hypothetical protein
VGLSRWGRVGEHEDFSRLLGTEAQLLGCLAISLVTTPTELSKVLPSPGDRGKSGLLLQRAP